MLRFSPRRLSLRGITPLFLDSFHRPPLMPRLYEKYQISASLAPFSRLSPRFQSEYLRRFFIIDSRR